MVRELGRDCLSIEGSLQVSLPFNRKEERLGYENGPIIFLSRIVGYVSRIFTHRDMPMSRNISQRSFPSVELVRLRA